MKLLELFRKESTTSPYRLAFAAAIAGMSNAAVLAIINIAAEHPSRNESNFQYAALFAITVCLYIAAQRYIMVVSNKEVETILHNIRVRLANMIRQCDLLAMEKIGRSELYASITKETQTISQVALMLAVGGQSAILIFFSSLYIAYISLTAFMLAAIFISIALSIHFQKRQELNENLHRTTASENKLFDSLTDMLNGFKEVKMNSARSADLFEDFEHISLSTAKLKIHTESEQSNRFIFSQASFLLLLATIVFIVPRVSSISDESVILLTTSILFLIGPISSLVATVPVLALANTAAENIFALEAALSPHIRPAIESSEDISHFDEIRFDKVIYQYPSSPGAIPFTVGPLDLTIKTHEVVFVVGGNGSGKSTFLKLLTCLYYPTSGAIWIDRLPLDETRYDKYRDQFSVIFSDYHLFKRLYGLQNVDKGEANKLLRDMEIEGKTRLLDGEFETIDLSAGQKKRLALLVSLLEDKPIYVFDEWAADQDPVFRRKFYEQILQALKQKGKTIIAVTHDEKYYGVADRIVKMEEGRFIEIRTNPAGSRQTVE